MILLLQRGNYSSWIRIRDDSNELPCIVVCVLKFVVGLFSILLSQGLVL